MNSNVVSPCLVLSKGLRKKSIFTSHLERTPFRC